MEREFSLEPKYASFFRNVSFLLTFHPEFLGCSAKWKPKQCKREPEISVVSEFSKNRITSGGVPHFPGGFFRNALFLLTFHPKFPVFSAKWNLPTISSFVDCIYFTLQESTNLNVCLPSHSSDWIIHPLLVSSSYLSVIDKPDDFQPRSQALSSLGTRLDDFWVVFLRRKILLQGFSNSKMYISWLSKSKQDGMTLYVLGADESLAKTFENIVLTLSNIVRQFEMLFGSWRNKCSCS